MTATITNLPDRYDPFTTEAKWQKFWEENQTYKADPHAGGEPYCIVIPPPNVTGSLHMGHAFDNSLIDTLVRYHRMKGDNALYLPGTDHASIAVHTMLEKQLKVEGKTRYELGREKFLERAWQWKRESGGTIVNQLRRLGVSVDWSRERFTLDAGLSKAVLEAFNRLYEEGLIYRGKYLVNWCPESQSAVSDLEVDAKEVDGHLWHFRYPLSDGSGYVEVATTRPETMLGDTAVAVNPNDERYQHLIGKTITLPIMNREIPIIGDELVDPTFGTGCVKVTPAHDPNDFEMGKRHSLPFINIMNKDGSLNENAGEFQGQDRFVARKNVVARLEADGFLVKVEDYKHSVPYSERGKVPVEPLLSTQWFVKIRPLADRALEFLDEKNSPRFVPQRWTKVYRDWLVKLKDWCISRQLWWGHQIPAWYAVSETGGEITENTPFVVARSETEAREMLESQFGENVKVEQDPDVLDTWFSSGLWPFSTLGWPEQTPDLATYYPTSTLVTGFDIIFFWVARMTMMAGHFTGQMPFKDVYIHGLVLDENGQKQSKTKGNGIDPLILIEKYGTDALRYTMIKEVAGAGQDIRMDYNRKTDESPSVEASRNFANKLWNAARFVMMNLDGQTPQQLGEPNPTELSDRWILSRYHRVVQQTRNYLDNYGLGEAAKGLYEFIWGDFCDWYIELVKSRLQKNADPISRRVAQQTLAYVLEGILKLLSPFMPHITEEIWHTLTQQGAETKQSLSRQLYPEAQTNFIDSELEEQFELLIATIRTIRNLRAEADVKPGARVNVNLQTDSKKERQILTAGQSYIQDLAKVENLTITGGESQQPTEKPRIGWENIAVTIALIYFFRLGLAIADAVDDIPLLGSFFEVIGFGYATWFVGQNILSAEARQKFWQQLFKPSAEQMASSEVSPQPQAPEKAIAGVVGTVQVLLPLAGVVDIDAYVAKLQKRLTKLEGEIKSLSGRLSNPKFVEQAPPNVVRETRDALAEAQKQAEILRDRLRQLA
ncbi:valine--tRNA ligase [Fischerella thermalis WC542]|jgi:valyl-tRNA synthetase|uniref:valine--tRNA ligase n=1 Tax=Fischerella thermalis TaxID=372787 RepID=UPI0002F94E0F|nr:valine--tRNA ligase [Fischerella thermalis]PLZ29793.1 valine--tRNA ligase [Fischerella thermalis WC559]PLZ31636.1 valine--tRNA ligase [Fischerella thermalis WC558]PLZ36534.1 valine--tRNA ligase [Fischerella thermalis WC542]PLZ55712.1 valine--tRNA ligase [Fischerella thermalis WC439]PLZ59487.1 valine--tRNA ligase [Fischerella thermalis WC442]